MAMKNTQELLENWIPKTELGKKVKNKEITNIDDILNNGQTILEPEIIDTLLPDLTSELLEVGQSKGKFGGGKGSIWRQTQKTTSEGSRTKFATFAIVGNKNGYIGASLGSAKETVPAREKAIRKAKLNIIKIKRGCGSWACNCHTPHSIPFKTEGKEGSVKVELMPAPKGTGIKAEKKISKMISLSGIKDVHTKTYGKTATKLNLFRACFYALKNISKVKVKDDYTKETGSVEGKIEQ